jgi:hypothetical protein
MEKIQKGAINHPMLTWGTPMTSKTTHFWNSNPAGPTKLSKKMGISPENMENLAKEMHGEASKL